MRNRLILVVLAVLVLSFAVGAIAGTSGKETWRDGEVAILGKDLNEIRQRLIVTPYTTVVASNTLVIPVTHSYVRITPGTDTATYTLSIAAGVDGQHIFIYNGGASATYGLAAISAGKCGHIMYASGAWCLIADE